MPPKDTLENAQRRAEYWKAEHTEANAEIDCLRSALNFSASWIESGRPIDGLAEQMRAAASARDIK